MLRALVTIGAAQVITMLVLFVRTKSLALMLGPENLGVMSVVDKLLAVITQTVSLSLPFAAARFLPERWEVGPLEFRRLFIQMRNVLLALITSATAVSLLIAWMRPRFWGDALLPYRSAVIVAMIGMPAIALVTFLQQAVAGRLQQNRSMAIGFLNAMVMTVAVAGIAWGGLAGYYMLFAVLGMTLVVIATRMALTGTDAPPNPIGEPARSIAGLPVRVWRFSGALLTLTFVAPYAALFIHYRLLRDHGPETAGWMQAAIGIGLAVRQVLGGAHAVYLTPNVNRGGTPEQRMAWANRFQMTLCLLAGLTVPPLLMVPAVAIRVLYSPAFGPGAAFVILFVLTEMVGMLSGTYQSLIVALDHLRFHVVTNLIAQLLVIGSAYALVRPLGILGAGLAGIAAPAFLYLATMVFLSRSYGLRMPPAVSARSAWLLFSLVSTGLFGARFPELTLALLPLKAALYAIVLAGFAGLLNDDERQRVRETIDILRTRRA